MPDSTQVVTRRRQGMHLREDARLTDVDSKRAYGIGAHPGTGWATACMQACGAHRA